MINLIDSCKKKTKKQKNKIYILWTMTLANSAKLSEGQGRQRKIGFGSGMRLLFLMFKINKKKDKINKPHYFTFNLEIIDITKIIIYICYEKNNIKYGRLRKDINRCILLERKLKKIYLLKKLLYKNIFIKILRERNSLVFLKSSINKINIDLYVTKCCSQK